MLEFLPVVKEEASVVGAKGEACDGAAASAERAAVVVPPGLAEVEAVCQRWAGYGSESTVDRLEAERFVVFRFGFEFGMEIGDEEIGLVDEARAVGVAETSQGFGYP